MSTALKSAIMYYTLSSILIIIIIIIIRESCPRPGISLQMQEPRLQFCPKRGLPQQTQEPRVAVLLGINRCGSFPLFSTPHSLFSTWADLKRLENIPGAPTWKSGERIWLSRPSGLHRHSPLGLNIIFWQIREPEIPITLRPPYYFRLSTLCLYNSEEPWWTEVVSARWQCREPCCLQSASFQT